MGLDEVLAAMKAKPKTGEEVRIEQAKAANAGIQNPAPAPAVPPVPDKKPRHVKDEFGGSISDIPVGHSYWNRRFRK